jgi:hypothetical protein
LIGLFYLGREAKDAMKTYMRICIKDFSIEDKTGQKFSVKRGEEYLTSGVDKNGEVTVFTGYWVNVPVDIFWDGVIEFTPD